MLLIYLTIFVSIFWWGFPFWADKKGEEAARNQIKAYLEKGCVIDKKSGWNNCLLLLDENDNVLHEGLFIAKNDYELAMFKKEGAFLIKLKESYLIKKNR